MPWKITPSLLTIANQQISGHILQILFAQTEVILSTFIINSFSCPFRSPSINYGTKIILQFFKQQTVKITNFMQSNELMLQLWNSLPGSRKKTTTFTKCELCFGKTFSFPRLNPQNTSLFISLFSICKCFQCLKVKFADPFGHVIYECFLCAQYTH